MRMALIVLSAIVGTCELWGADSNCAHAKLLSGTSCKDAKVEFDLTNCIEPDEKKTIGTTCKGTDAVATLKTTAATYTATFKSEAAWGETQWTMAGLNIIENKKGSKKAAGTLAKKEEKKHSPNLPDALLARANHKEEVAPHKEEASTHKEEPAVHHSAQPEAEPARVTSSESKEPDAGEGKLTGNWRGYRNKMAKRGLSLGLTYGAEPSYNFMGGIEKKGTYMGKSMFLIDQDLSHLVDWTGGSLHFGVMGTHGTGPSAYVGDTQATSNIDAKATVRLYEAWFQQSVAEDSASFRLGMYDFNSEFYVTETALVFLNSSFGVGKELSQSPANGSMGPSIYPVPSVGGRVRVNAGKNTYLLLGVLDGVAGDPTDPYGTKVYLNKADGLFMPAEVGFTWGREESSWAAPGKWSLGAWTYTQAVNTIQPTDSGAVEKAVSHGFYTSLEQTMIKNFSIFLRYGVASKDVNAVASNLAGGFVVNKVLPLWDNDQLGVGVTTAFLGADYLESQEAAGTPKDSSEIAFELLYRFEVLPGFALQPDLQYVINPSMDPTRDNAFVGALRADFNL